MRAKEHGAHVEFKFGELWVPAASALLDLVGRHIWTYEKQIVRDLQHDVAHAGCPAGNSRFGENIQVGVQSKNTFKYHNTTL